MSDGRTPAAGAAAPGVPGRSPQPLEQALRLFREFAAAGVIYCHFKSNEHLEAALAGETDLDLLVDRRDARLAQSVLIGAGYRRFASRMAGAYPGVEDYLGFDAAAGRLIHVHLHFALVLGELHLKSYQARLGETILATRVRDAATGVFITHPDVEMLLLLVRAALKLRWRDHAIDLLGRRYLRGGLLREYRWLLQRVRPDRVREAAVGTLGPAAAAAVGRLLDAAPTIGGLRRLRAKAKTALADQRTYGTPGAFLLRSMRETAWWFSAVNRRWLRLPVAARRVDPIGGLVVTFLGPDGCGKSSLTRAVRKWLAWKLDVQPVYFGSGSGSVSPLRWPLKIALGLYRRVRFGTPAPPAQGDGAIRKARWVWAIALALEKRSRMRTVARARNRGMVVICDRYPQAQVIGFNDGPLLGAWVDETRAWRRRIARWEIGVYRDLVRNAPDLAIKLRVSPEVARLRKPEITGAETGRRLEALARIDFGDRCRHLVVDADRPFDQVLADVKRAVWDQL
jgi:thymidylate kinase